jgi:hypothetical protein
MAVPRHELNILYMRSGGICAFPACSEVLAVDGPDGKETVILGHVSHIVGQSDHGPRGQAWFPPAERDKQTNLILFCTKHHAEVDGLSATYTVERLMSMKEAHEEAVRKSLSLRAGPTRVTRAMVTETLHSNLLPVEVLPRYAFSGAYAGTEDDVRQMAKWPADYYLSPFVVRGGRLYSFQDLASQTSTFGHLVDNGTTQRHRLADWWEDIDQTNLFITLVNKALNALARQRGLMYDRDHHRHYFAPSKAGEPRRVAYRPPKQSVARKSVVWQPKSRKYGVGLSFWVHRAVQMRLLEVSPGQWVLSINPDLRITKDGLTELPPDEIGEKVTRRKNRWFNFDYLTEIQFWRHFLSDGKARLVLPFAEGSAMLIENKLLQTQVTWPGIPQEHAKAFANVEYSEDLWSTLELQLFDTDRDDDVDEPSDG